MPQRLDDPMLDQVSLQLAQRPTPIGQPQGGRRCLGEAHDLGHLRGRDPRWCTAGLQLRHGAQPVVPERMHIRVDGVGVNAQCSSNRHGVQTCGVQDQRLCPSPLAWVHQVFEPLAQPANVGGRGTMNFHRARHGYTSVCEGLPVYILTNVSGQILT
jgi:hypothetical protein